jgi:diguanylate cyclase (GGDEF)-like protein
MNASAGAAGQLARQLAGNQLFAGVAADILEHIAQSARVLDLAPGDILLSPERSNQHVYLLLDGSLTIHFGAPDSPEISELGPGISVGEMSVIDGTAPSAYVIAKTSARVFPLRRDLIIELVEGANPVAHNLLRQITRWVKTNKQHFMQARTRIEELTSDANLDELTGLYNRRWLEHALPRLLELDAPQCLLMLDVDHFKRYNDTQGHLGGDQALVALANVLKTTLRPYDYAARYGGEEFVVLLPNVGLGEAVEVAERIRLSVASCPVRDAEGAPLPGISLSIGVAAMRPGMSPEALIRAADAQLYQAKAAGRNCVRY